MILSHSFGLHILRIALVTPLFISAVLVAATSWAQGQPPAQVPSFKISEAEKTRQLKERDRIKAEAITSEEAGKLDDAVAAQTKALAIERGALGELHEDLVASLQLLARLHVARDDLAAARTAYTEVLAIRQRQPDRKDWQIADAKRSLADLEQQAALQPAQRQQLLEANRLNGLVRKLFSQGKYAEAIDPCRKAMKIRGELLGQSHPGYAASLSNLGLLYHRMGDYAKAEPLYRQALEINKRTLGEDHPAYAGKLNTLESLCGAMAEDAESRGDWKAARKALTERLAIRERQRNQKDWLTADARRALADLDRRAALDPAQRQRLREADRLNGLSAMMFSQGRYAEGIEPSRKAMEIRGELLGRNHPDYADGLNDLAVLYANMGDYAKAEPLYRQALDIRKRVLGESHPNYAAGLNNLAVLYKDMGDYAKAEPLYRQALEIKKRALGENHPDYATSLNNLAVLYKAMGDYKQAEPLYRQTLDIRKRALGEDHPDYAGGLNNLAEVYREMGDYAKVEPLCRQALEITKRALGEDHPNYASSLSSLAAFYTAMADYAKAEPLYRQALDIRKRALGENHPDYAAGLNNLALLYSERGDYAKAKSLYRQVLDIRKQALGENHPAYAGCLNNLAALYGDMGDYAKAEPLCRQALEIKKRTLGENHPDYATSMSNLAELYAAIGDYVKAEPLHRRALEIKKRALGENHPAYATSLSRLAALYTGMGEYAKAEPLFRHALEIRKRALSENHPEYAKSLNELAALYACVGEYAKAEPLERRACEIQKRALSDNHPDYAGSLNNLGWISEQIGNYATAEHLYRQALEIRRTALGANHPDFAASLNDLALLYYSQSQLAAAEHYLSEGLALLTRWTQGGLGALGERQRVRLLAAQGKALNWYLSIAPAAGVKSEDIYRHVLAWKGVVEARQDEDRLARDQPELKGTLKQLDDAHAQLARLAFATPPAGQHRAWLQQLDALRNLKENLESDLARKSATFRHVHDPWRLGAAEVAAALSPGSVLVDLLDYVHLILPDGGRGKLRIQRRVAAFVLRRGRPPALVSLGASRLIDEAVRAWRAALVPRMPERMQAAADDLRRRVWEPLTPYLEGATDVVVAPDGALAQFPLAALPGQRPGTYLIEDLAIGYVSSAHRLVETLARPREGTSEKTQADRAGLLAIGGVDYRADPGGATSAESVPIPNVLVADSQRSAFGALTGSGPEVRSIAQLFGAAFPMQQASVLTGAAPTEGAVKEQLGQHWLHLHFATHGFFESPARVAAIRAGFKSDDFVLAGVEGSEETASLSLAPLLHSGVALAGAGRMTEQDAGPGAEGSVPDREDGILTAEDVQAFDLRGTDLVVLSACETGLDKLENGQGVMGLQRAFQAAGARAVVASLWNVDDAATTVLMEQFYKNLWTKKMPKLEALRQAQLTVLNDVGLVRRRRAELTKERGIDEKPDKLPEGGRVAPAGGRPSRSDPALWAAFVLSGDGR